MWIRPFQLVLALAAALPVQAQQAKESKDKEFDELMELLNTPVKSASKREQRQADSPQGIEVITGEEIRRAGLFRLQDALKHMTGVDLVEFGNYASYMGLRGIMQQGIPRTVQVLVDGVPLYNAEYATIDVDNLPVPIDAIDRVEVVRGPSSTLYGANAVAGVVAITTKRPEKGSGGARMAAANLDTRRWSGDLSLGKDGRGVVAGFSGASFGPSGQSTRNVEFGYPTVLDRDRSHQSSFLVRPQWQSGGTTLWASAGGASKKVNFDALEWAQFQRFEVGTYQGGWRQSWAEGLATEVRVHRTSHRFTFGPAPFLFANFGGDPNFLGEYTWLDFRSDQAEIQLNWDPSASFHVVAGADGRRYRSGKAAFVGFQEEFKESASGAFLSVDWLPAPTLALTLGLRAENESIGGSRSSPRAAVVWNPTRSSTLRAGYFSSTRSPQILEARILFRSPIPPSQLPPPFTSGIFQIASDPGLRPEKIDGFEFGYRGLLGPASVDLTLYRMKLDRLVVQGALPPEFPAPDQILVKNQYQNGGSATNDGLELALNWQAAKVWTVGLNGAWMKFRKEDGSKVSWAPGWKANLWTRAALGSWNLYLAYQRVDAVETEALGVGAGNSLLTPREALDQLQAQVAFSFGSGFSLGAYGRNITRESTPQGAGGPTRYNLLWSARREMGISFSGRF